MFILKKGHQPGVYVPLRALFLVIIIIITCLPTQSSTMSLYTDIQSAAMFCNVDTSSKGYRRQNQSGMYLVSEFIM